MACDEALRVQAYLDGELDAAGVLEVERHLEECRDCAALRDDLLALQDQLRGQAPYHRASPQLRASIARALDAESGTSNVVTLPIRRSFWSGALSGAGATALAAALAFFVLMPPSTDALVDDVTAAHLRSLMGTHLIDVASSDHHTVKPWFAGHTDVSPPAVNYTANGFVLVGGRADFVHGMRTAVVVYRHGAHVINMFAWADQGGAIPAASTRNGYHQIFWKNGNMVLCAVSDTAPEELEKFVALIKSASARE